MQGFELLSGSVVDPDAAVLPDPVSDRSGTLKISVADPDPGSGAFLTPGSRMSKKSRFVSGMHFPNHITESLEAIL
jgi:hypothetical protein